MQFSRLFKAVLIANALAFSPVYADRIVQSGIQGIEGKTVRLRVDDNLENVFKLFRDWEGRLKAKGLEVEFLIGAGDLRRALLGMHSNGGGDVEVYVHVKNKNLYPNVFRKTLALFESHGVNITQELQQMLGENDKVVDIFIRDQLGIENDRPYETEIAVFEGLGDNSINALTYSVTRNLMLGSPENLRFLADGKIVFLETFKTRKLDVPAKVPLLKDKAAVRAPKGQKKPKEEYFSDYPYTILRQDFRSTRLAVDLILQKDFVQGSFVMDTESFATPMAGTELFFASVPDEVIPRYELHPKDDSYIQVFLKMFRKRTNAELAAIRTILNEKFPRKVELWKRMGLDIDLLTEPRTDREDRAKLEFRAVFQNPRYDQVRELVDLTTYEVANPFSAPEAFLRMAQACGSELTAPIPHDILRLYSPELFLKSQNFDLLTLEEKLHTVDKYKAALKFFEGKAYVRLVKQLTLRNGYLDRFHFINPSVLQSSDSSSLIEFLHAQWLESQVVGSTESVRPLYQDSAQHNLQIELEIYDAIKAAKRARKKPVVVVDLDNTLFESSSRVLAILQRYDEVSKTNYFVGLTLADLPIGDFKEFLYMHLMKQVSDFTELMELVEHICIFLQMNEWEYDFVSGMEAQPEMVQLLKAIEKQGAEVFFLTSRRQYQARATEESLRRLGLRGNVTYYTDDETSSVAEWKTTSVLDWIEYFKDLRIVGFLDNETATINRLRKELEELVDEEELEEKQVPVVARVHFRHQNRQSHAFLMHDEAELYPIHTRCPALIAQAGAADEDED
jgi:phosphoglycolate phosphatase-like HAD superfamily hydrolase